MNTTVSLNRLNVDLNPDVEFPFVTVTTVLEGASPETVETEVTDVLEEQINTIEGIRDLSSVSSEGISQIFVEFETDYEVDVKAQHVREKIAPVRAGARPRRTRPLLQDRPAAGARAPGADARRGRGRDGRRRARRLHASLRPVRHRRPE